MGFIEEKDFLIIESERVKSECYKQTRGFPAYLSGESYDIWMNKVKLFSDKYLKENPLYDELTKAYNARNNSVGTTGCDRVTSILKVLSNEEYESEFEELNKDKVLFISHSSRDIEYVALLVRLLEDMQIRDMGITIVCSSLSGYSIPNNKNIYEYLKTQFNKNIFVILILSDNYYSSIPCMNEMGATWIAANNYQAILTPEFEYTKVKGAIDASNICFKLDDKYRISELKDNISSFGKEIVTNKVWERKLDTFIMEVNNIHASEKYKAKYHNIDLENIVPDGEYSNFVFRFINHENINKKCICIDIEMEDNKSTKAEVRIANDQLKDIELFGTKNKRVSIKVLNDEIHNIKNFDKYMIKSWTVNYNIVRS